MKRELVERIEAQRNRPMSEQDRSAQRQSFAFGNARFENERVTRLVADTAARRIPPRPSAA